jgi:hypothetical protein
MHYKAYDALPADQQAVARARFGTRGRSGEWCDIRRWAFPINNANRVHRTHPYIEPAYSLTGKRFEEFWRPRGGTGP